MPKTVADKVIEFNQNLVYQDNLPPGYKVVNPFMENPETMVVMQQFYHKYYNDHKPRKFIIGINPSRHGAGVTGIPFTDTKRLDSACNIQMKTARTHEVSSVFVYDVIFNYGGPKQFYNDFYINSPFPLAITRKAKNGAWLNANYYDDKSLFEMTQDYMIDSLQKHIAIGLDTEEVYILGKKNANYLKKLNDKAKLFDRLVVLDHPRYIQQYKFKTRELYIDEYLRALYSEK
ncbi:MAG: SMUG2 DNA glycosylase family protein [Weeksellaceae bacterium]